MIVSNNIFNSPLRQVNAKVELYTGSTLANTFYNTDVIKSIKLSREGESNKFFGFGICQKLELVLVDKERTITIVNGNGLQPYFNAGGEYITPFPKFYVSETKRDEKTNELTIIAYDAVNGASAHTLAELELLDAPFTMSTLAVRCAEALGLTVSYDATNPAFGIAYDGNANFTGTESLRSVMNAIAEATQTIYYASAEGNLVFKTLKPTDTFSTIISRADYFELTSGDNPTLTGIASATELGDNVFVGDSNGIIQRVRDNPLWVLRDDLSALLEQGNALVSGLSIGVFNCSWRGNPHLEYGDKIALLTKEGQLINTYLLNETLEYNGGLKSTAHWELKEDTTEAEAAGVPISLGDVVRETYAKVDKVNKQISLVAQESADATEKVSQMVITVDEISGNLSQVETLANGINEAVTNLKLTQDSISATVGTFESVTDELGNEISSVREEVSTKLSKDEATLEFQKVLADGVDSVTTTTGFTFNETGLTVSKSGTEMETTITEDGMTVYKNGDEVLTADNEGVKAIDLHATTYLIIGMNSRFEDYEKDGEARTGCFWIGG